MKSTEKIYTESFLSELISHYISVCTATYVMLLGTIANHSGQEEATLCIVKCLKEDMKLVFQMRNKVCSAAMSRPNLKQQKNTWI